MSVMSEIRALRRAVAGLTRLVMQAAGGGVTDHGDLTGLTPDDDHPQYLKTDGSRAVTGEIAGVDPTVDASLATKKYVDDAISGAGGGTGVYDVLQLTNQVAAPSPTTGAGRLYIAPTNFYTKLLLHCNGDDDGVVFTDETGKTVTGHGDIHTHQGEKKFGNASLYFDGNGDYLTLDPSDDFKFLTADFTIDWWLYPTSFAANQNIMDLLVDGGAGARNDSFCVVLEATTGKLKIFKSGGFSSATSGALTLNAWNHVAIANISGTFKFFINGTLDATTTTIPSVTSGGLVIGKNSDGASGYFVGHMEEIRVSKGIARWTANFTPPTAEYPAELALCFKSTSGAVTVLAFGS